MKRVLFHYGLLGLVIVTAATAFSVSRNLNRRKTDSQCTSEWLCLSGRQCQNIRQQDPGFKVQAQALALDLQAQQQALIALIRQSDVGNDAIRSQAQRVVDTHHQLMRRVVKHLLVVRQFSDPQQCLQLKGLCAHTLGGHGQGLQRGRQMGLQHGGGQGLHGQGRMQGRGMGMGRQRRRGPLAPVLALTENQQAELLELDPTFDADVTALTEEVRVLHQQFTQGLADPNVSEDTVLADLEAYIATHSQLERRTVDHVLKLRPLLSPEQQERLIGLSQRGCRWRGGQGAGGP